MSEYRSLTSVINETLSRRQSLEAASRSRTPRTEIKNVARPEDDRKTDEEPTRQGEIQNKVVDEESLDEGSNKGKKGTKTYNEPGEDEAVKVKNRSAFDRFAKQGGWKNSKEFSQETGASYKDLKGKKFSVIHNRVYVNEDESEEAKASEPTSNEKDPMEIDPKSIPSGKKTQVDTKPNLDQTPPNQSKQNKMESVELDESWKVDQSKKEVNMPALRKEYKRHVLHIGNKGDGTDPDFHGFVNGKKVHSARKKSDVETALKKHVNSLKENVELSEEELTQLDEISKELGMRYLDKVAKQKKEDEKTSNKLNRAKDDAEYEKHGGEKKHKEVTDRLIKRQTKGIEVMRGKLTGKAKVPLSGGKHKVADYVSGEVKKLDVERDKKVARAKRLRGEDVEYNETGQLDEISADLEKRYYKKADREYKDKQHSMDPKDQKTVSKRAKWLDNIDARRQRGQYRDNHFKEGNEMELSPKELEKLDELLKPTNESVEGSEPQKKEPIFNKDTGEKAELARWKKRVLAWMQRFHMPTGEFRFTYTECTDQNPLLSPGIQTIELTEDNEASVKVAEWIEENREQYIKENGQKIGEQKLYNRAWNMYENITNPRTLNKLVFDFGAINEGKFKPKEHHLEILDDYMHNRGQFKGSDEDGHNALKKHAPELSKKERHATIKHWKKESGWND